MKNYYEILEVDKNASQEVIEKAYRALAKKYHTDLPNTHIYYFGIEPRTYSLPYKVSMKESIAEITKVNDAMIAYATENEYFTYLDSPSLCYNSDGSVKESFFKDGIHPKLENYSYYVKLLEDAGITYKKVKGVSNYSDFTTQKSQNSGATGLVVIHEGTQLTNNYVMSGTIDIQDVMRELYYISGRSDGLS